MKFHPGSEPAPGRSAAAGSTHIRALLDHPVGAVASQRMRLVFYRAAASALTFTLLVSQAALADQCAPIRTNIVTDYALGPSCTSPVGVCTVGTLFSGRIAATTRFTARSVMPGLSPDLLVYAGELVLTLSDGTITIRDHGLLNSTTAYFFEVQQVISGTGAYARATGLLTSRGLSTPTGFQGLVTGTICTPVVQLGHLPPPPRSPYVP